MYVNSLKIKNLRCFREVEFELQHSQKIHEEPLKFPNINLLLGNNGSGKSSILKALALSTLAPVLKGGSGLTIYRMVRNTSAKTKSFANAELSANVLLHEQDFDKKRKPQAIEINSIIQRIEDTEELDFISGAAIPQGIYRDNSPAFLVVGYGVTRKVEETINFGFKENSRRRRLRYQRVASLFEDNYGLVPLQSWLPEMRSSNPGRYKQVVNLINRLSPDDMEFKGKFLNDEFYFNFRETEVPFGSLSDGYRHFIGWIADLLYHICMGAPSGKKLVDNYGLVLVDEIDLLLHPEWQRTVLQCLSQTLPNLQFVFTTHSPIVASSVENRNIFVMETDTDGSALVRQYDETIYGQTAEQVLLSSYFGLQTTRPESFVKEQIEPLSDKAIKGDEKAALEFMEKLARPIEIDRSKFEDFTN
jgi:AAA15 family ATPase/GTPase